MTEGNCNLMSKRIATAGEVLSNGYILDLVRPNGSERLGLVLWNKVKTATAGQVGYKDKTYVPVEMDASYREALLLPAGAASGTPPTTELFGDLSILVSKYLDLSQPAVAPVVYFIFASWLADRIPVAPFLSIVSPDRADGLLLLELLSLLCRRPLLLTADGPADLWSLPFHLRPTLLLYGTGLTPPVRKFLLASNARGVLTPRKGKALDLYCAKAFCSPEPLPDRALANSALQIVLHPKRRELPTLTAAESRGISELYQPILLRYRLSKLQSVQAPKLDLQGLTAQSQGIARSLAACVVDDEELQSGIVPLLRRQEREGQVDRSTGLETVVLEALLLNCHNGKGSTLRAAELAETVNSILAAKGDSMKLSPESVGWKLKVLGFRTEPIGASGNGLWLLNEIRSKIHDLALENGLLLDAQISADGCPQCARLRETVRS